MDDFLGWCVTGLSWLEGTCDDGINTFYMHKALAWGAALEDSHRGMVSWASPFVTTFLEMLEMRYAWKEPVRLDNTRLIGELGREPHAPPDEAVDATLRSLGCVSPQA